MRHLAIIGACLAVTACTADKDQREQARERAGVVLTAGQAIDCAADNLDEGSRTVCADEQLRVLDRQVATVWAQLSQDTGRPTTLARRHALWLEERAAGQRDWNTGEDHPRTAEDMRDFYEGYLGALREELRIADALPPSAPGSALAGGCVGSALSNCQAPAAGYVTAPGGQRLAWQIQTGSTDFSGVSSGIILFRIQGDLLIPIGWSFDGVYFEPPVMVEQNGALYVAAVGVQMGTGAANADILFRLDGDAWTEIELESWKFDLAERLPEGLGVWKGVQYRWREFMAMSSLWRDGDANCCATGGEAVMTFTVQGTSLRLASLEVMPTEATAP